MESHSNNNQVNPLAETQIRADERRAYERKQLKVEVDFHTETNFFAGFMNDISEGGLFLSTYCLLTVGSEIDLEFTLPDGHEIRVKGEVRWVREPRDLVNSEVAPGMGIRFLALSDEDRTKIEEFVSLREPMFYEA